MNWRRVLAASSRAKAVLCLYNASEAQKRDYFQSRAISSSAWASRAEFSFTETLLTKLIPNMTAETMRTSFGDACLNHDSVVPQWWSDR